MNKSIYAFLLEHVRINPNIFAPEGAETTLNVRNLCWSPQKSRRGIGDHLQYIQVNNFVNSSPCG